MTIFWRTIRDKKLMIIIFCVAVVFLITMYIGMYPSIQKQAQNFTQVFESLKGSFMKAFNFESFDFSTVENFIAIEQFSITWPLVVLFFVLSLAGTALAGEIERGTVEIMASRPVSRLGIFWGKYLAGLFGFAIFVICSTMFTPLIARIFGISTAYHNFFTVALLGFLFGWAIFSLGMFFSAMFSERSKVYMICGGIFVGMYVINIFSSLKDSLDKLKYLSFFHYFDGQKALIHNSLDKTGIIVFIAVIIVFTAAGAWWFKKRDIAV